MPDFDKLLRLIDDGAPVDAVRREIAAAMTTAIHAVEAEGGYWEKALVHEALRALEASSAPGERNAAPWLRLSVTSLQRALVPAASRDGAFTTQAGEIEELGFAELKERARRLGRSA